MRMSLSFVGAGMLGWVFATLCISLSLGLQDGAQTCDLKDLSAMKKFMGNLSAGSMIAAWSSDQTCCEWDGVFCGSSKDGTGMSRVIKLVLLPRGLAGVISGSLGRMDLLMLLDLSYNSRRNELPLELSSLNRLQILDLSYNLLSGPWK